MTAEQVREAQQRSCYHTMLERINRNSNDFKCTDCGQPFKGYPIATKQEIRQAVSDLLNEIITKQLETKS